VVNEPLFHIFVCTNRRPIESELPSCAGNGGEELLEEFRAQIFRLGLSTVVKVTGTGCLTPCHYGANVVIYPAGIWYCLVKQADVEDILKACINGTDPIDRLRLPESVRVL